MNREQLKTILWLRWRLMCNQWRRSGGALGAVLTAFLALLAAWVCFLSFAGGFLGGMLGLGKVSPTMMMMVWLGVTVVFLFFWMIGLLTELQRSETIDLQKLMHLPVALGQIFVVNYLASHLTLSIALIVPAIFGLGIGLTVSRGPEMLLMIPLALSMVLMITAWTYCLRGWLASMMSNPRRRRTFIMGITLAFILLGQVPNLYFNVFVNRSTFHGNREERQREVDAREGTVKKNFSNLIAAQPFVPPLWVPVGARALAGGNPLPALLGTFGCGVLAALGLQRAYRGMLKFYHGETSRTAGANFVASAKAKKSSTPRPKNKKDFLELSIPFAPEQSSALALATLRSLLRAPEVKMAWATSFIVTIILGAAFFLHANNNVAGTVKPFVATASVVFPVFFLAQFFANQFGFDRDGFRAVILSPADRRLILLGKNLAALPVAVAFGALLIALAAARLHLPTLTILATLFQFASVLMMAGLAGNLLSILVPYRIQPGSMKPTKMPALAMLVLIFCQMLFPMAMLPVFAGPLLEFFWRRLAWPEVVPVNLICSAVLLGLMTLTYGLLLAPMGRLLQLRETKILAAITLEVE